MSPAQRHRMKVLSRLAGASALAAGPAPHGDGPAATEYAMMLARLGLDLRRLHDIQSVEAKIALKRELLPEYAIWNEGVLAGMIQNNRGVEDEVFVTTMIWHLDTQDYATALPMAEATLRYELALPERYKRTPATLVTEEIADAALKRIGQGEDFDLDILHKVEALTTDHDMHDQVRSKLHKAVGLLLARAADAIDGDSNGPAGGKRAAVDTAIRTLERARELNPSCGVKKELDRLKREAVRLAAEAAGTEQPSG